MSHLNNIQRLCTNLEGDTELVVGEVYGMRQWNLYKNSHQVTSLIGHNSKSWDVAGVNEAKCALTHRNVYRYVRFDTSEWGPEKAARTLELELERMFFQNPEMADITVSLPQLIRARKATMSREAYAPYFPWVIINGGSFFRVEHDGFIDLVNEVIEFKLVGRNPVPPHQVTDPGCTCGFYAYTDEHSLDKNSYRGQEFNNSIFGIIKAWGYVTEGTKGFRAQKAQIVGLTVPLNYGFVKVRLNVPGPTPVFVREASEKRYLDTLDQERVRRTVSDWYPSQYSRNLVEHGAIPSSVPRFNSYDEMLRIFYDLSGKEPPAPVAQPDPWTDIGYASTPDFIRNLFNP